MYPIGGKFLFGLSHSLLLCSRSSLGSSSALGKRAPLLDPVPPLLAGGARWGWDLEVMRRPFSCGVLLIYCGVTSLFVSTSEKSNSG